MDLLLTIREVDGYFYEEEIKFMKKLKIAKKECLSSFYPGG